MENDLQRRGSYESWPPCTTSFSTRRALSICWCEFMYAAVCCSVLQRVAACCSQLNLNLCIHRFTSSLVHTAPQCRLSRHHKRWATGWQWLGALNWRVFCAKTFLQKFFFQKSPGNVGSLLIVQQCHPVAHRSFCFLVEKGLYVCGFLSTHTEVSFDMFVRTSGTCEINLN